MNANDYLKKIIDGKNLSEEEAEEIADMLLDNNIDEALASAILVSLKMKGETAEEIVGFAKSLRKHALKLQYPNAIDVVGTGGDGLNTINVSTAVSIMLSQLSKVAKHGNRAASSKSGSADFLEALGYNINIDPDKAKLLLEKDNFVFLFAQNYHKSMKNVAPIRKKLGIRTIFNLIGPLTNPFNVQYIIIGVYPQRYIEVLSDAVKILKYERAILLTADPGIDEVSPSGKTKIIEIRRDKEETFYIDPNDFKIERFDIKNVAVSSPEESVIRILRASLGKDKYAEDFIRINASLGLYLINKSKSLDDGYELSEDLLRNLKDRIIEIVSSNGNIDKLKYLLVKANGY